MQGAHVSAHVVDGRADRVGVGVTHRVHSPPEDAQVAVLVGNQVVAAHARQLRAVLERAQEAVAGGQLVGVGACDVAAFAQRADRLQGRAHPQEGVSASVNQLKQLHGELDVA